MHVTVKINNKIIIFAESCAAGEYSPTGFAPCKKCPKNFYQTDTGQITCIECEDNQITDGAGKTLQTECQDAGKSEQILLFH